MAKRPAKAVARPVAPFPTIGKQGRSGRTAGQLHSAHLERDFATEAEAIGAFVMRPEVEARLEAAFFRIEEPRLQKIVSDVLYT